MTEERTQRAKIPQFVKDAIEAEELLQMTSTQNLDIKAGELICFSEGEYSEYGYIDHFVALQDVSRKQLLALAQSLRDQEEAETIEYGQAKEQLIPRMIANGWLLSINCREIHIGRYGTLDIG